MDNFSVASLFLLMQERESLEEERSRVKELRRRCEEKEKLIPTLPESQREQLTVQLQQVGNCNKTLNYDQNDIMTLRLMLSNNDNV